MVTQVTPVQLREVLKVCQGCHIHNLTAKQLVVEINRYYYDYLDRLDDGPSPDPDVTEAEMFVFLALTIQMGHGIRDKLRLLVDFGSGIHTFLWHYDEPGQIPSHPSLHTFY